MYSTNGIIGEMSSIMMPNGTKQYLNKKTSITMGKVAIRVIVSVNVIPAPKNLDVPTWVSCGFAKKAPLPKQEGCVD
jgi:hypothetical protein